MTDRNEMKAAQYLHNVWKESPDRYLQDDSDYNLEREQRCHDRLMDCLEDHGLNGSEWDTRQEL